MTKTTMKAVALLLGLLAPTILLASPEAPGDPFTEIMKIIEPLNQMMIVATIVAGAFSAIIIGNLPLALLSLGFSFMLYFIPTFLSALQITPDAEIVINSDTADPTTPLLIAGLAIAIAIGTYALSAIKENRQKVFAKVFGQLSKAKDDELTNMVKNDISHNNSIIVGAAKLEDTKDTLQNLPRNKSGVWVRNNSWIAVTILDDDTPVTIWGFKKEEGRQ